MLRYVTFYLSFMACLVLAMLLAIVVNTNRITAAHQKLLDRWTGTDQATWVEELKKSNPGLVIPPARAVHKD